LKYLRIYGGRGALNEFQEAVHATSEGCPLLEVLKIDWTVNFPPKLDESNCQRPHNITFFSSKFCIYFMRQSEHYSYEILT